MRLFEAVRSAPEKNTCVVQRDPFTAGFLYDFLIAKTLGKTVRQASPKIKREKGHIANIEQRLLTSSDDGLDWPGED